jgi:hypothetical protein
MCCYTTCCLITANPVFAANNPAEVGIERLSGSISGRCFEDVNQNGQADDAEHGVPDITLIVRRLYGFSFNPVAVTKTDSAGNYIFSIKKWGIYQIEEVDPPGWTSTTPNKVILLLGLLNREQVMHFGNLPNDSVRPEVSISASPSMIQKGASSTLIWFAKNADTVTIDQGIGSVPAGGTLEVFPQVNTSYTVTAVGHGETAQSSVTVTVILPQPPPPETTTTTAPSTTTAQSSTTTTSAVSTTVPPTTSISSTTSTVQEPPTVIGLASFNAAPGNEEVRVSWVTASEMGTAGFNIYRADAADAVYEKLNASLIPAQGTGSSGAAYQYLDTQVVNRITYYYTLEDMGIDGSARLHGPVSTTPRFIHGIK